MGVLASRIGRKSDAIGRKIGRNLVTMRHFPSKERRAGAAPGGWAPDLPDLFQHGAGLVVDIDQALVDRVGEGLDRDVAIRPRRSGFQLNYEWLQPPC